MRLIQTIIVLFTATLFLGCIDYSKETAPAKVAVLMSTQGELMDITAIEWVQQSVNAAGGILGQREIQFVQLNYADDVELDQTVDKILAPNSEYLAVIGPPSSDQLERIGGKFISAKVVLVSPSSTSSEVTRKFANRDYIWRTTASDIGQVETMLSMARQRNAQKVGMVTSYDTDGYTFFTWFPFFAQDIGFSEEQIIRPVRFTDFNDADGCKESLISVLDQGADMIFVAPPNDMQTQCAIETFHKYKADKGTDYNATLFFSTYGYNPKLMESLGDKAQGVEGLLQSAPPETGFEVAYKQQYPDTEALPPFAANMYDAALLLAYALEDSRGRGGKSLVNSVKRVVNYRGYDVGWDSDGISHGLSALRNNQRPNINGATGNLSYNTETYVDLKSTVFGLWKYDSNRTIVRSYVTTGESTIHTQSVKAAYPQPTVMNQADYGFKFGGTSSSDDTPANSTDDEIKDLWVVIAATSSGWENYRHQADALNQYQYFKTIKNVPDNRIIMIGADDIANNPANPERGVVRNIENGPNLYKDVDYDYYLSGIEPEDLNNILAGKRTANTPIVVEGGPQSNIYVFIVGHGADTGVAFEASTAESAFTGGLKMLSPDSFSSTLCGMQRHTEGRKFRQMLIVMESCHSGVFGESLESFSCPDGPEGTDTINDVLLLTAANGKENSLAANYDPSLRTWLADQFAYRFYTKLSAGQSYSLHEVYQAIYREVSGSHVKLYNSANHSQDVRATQLSDFIDYPVAALAGDAVDDTGDQAKDDAEDAADNDDKEGDSK